jgi:hypothetical protein
MNAHIAFIQRTLLGTALTAACLCPRAEAATITVISAADAGAGTLRAAIAAANPLGGDTINFGAALNGKTIVLTTGELVVDKNLTITGLGATHLGIEAHTHRVFRITGSKIVTISGLRLKGRVTGAAGANGTPGSPHGQDGSLALGGAILEEWGCLVQVDYCHFEGCEALGGAGGNAYYSPGIPAHGGNGGMAGGGAICNSGGDLLLYGCAFGFANSATGGAGGKGGYSGAPGSFGGNGGMATGGAVVTMYGSHNLSIVNCTFAGNGAFGGAGGQGGDSPGGIGAGAEGGDGGQPRGGAIFVTQGCGGCTGIRHTTINTNVCRSGGGGAGGSGLPAGAPGNDGVADGLGLYFAGTGGPADSLPMDNTLIAANVVAPPPGSTTLHYDSADVRGVIASTGYNLIGNSFGSSGWVAAGVQRDLLGSPAGSLDPRLGPFQSYGGETPTAAPLACSPAIDAGSDCVGCVTHDQIDQLRPVLVTATPAAGKGSDIGAYELQSYPAAAAVPLRITPAQTGNGVMIAWPASSCFVLQQSLTLDPPDWENNLNPVSIVGAEKRVFITPAVGNMFYRLHP